MMYIMFTFITKCGLCNKKSKILYFTIILIFNHIKSIVVMRLIHKLFIMLFINFHYCFLGNNGYKVSLEILKFKCTV